MSNVEICNINNKIDAIQKQLYKSTYSTKLPEGLVAFIPPYKHNLTQIKGYIVFNPEGEEIEVSFKILSDKSVQIESNISLLSCKLILF